MSRPRLCIPLQGSKNFPVSVCIVIPVYKNTLTPHEQVSLRQCVRVLGQHPLVLVMPVSLNAAPLLAAIAEARQNTNVPAPEVAVVRFADDFFQSVQTYNRLMLLPAFYQAFAHHEYLLIHQLDAFVFRDDLDYWCRRGYDYVGAPWLRDQDFSGSWAETWFNAKKTVARWLNLRQADGIRPKQIITLNAVGNGGLSLRHVANALGALRRFGGRAVAYETGAMHEFNEDVFWGVEVNRYWPHLRVPDFRTALHFAVEFYPERAVNHYNKGQLPFGCHAWDIHGTDFWRPIFAQYGHTI